MAMFPAAPPATFELKPGATSGYFRREERAFFAQGDRESMRLRVQTDVSSGPVRRGGHDKGKGRESQSRPYLAQIPSPSQTNSAAPMYNQANTRTRGPSVPVPSSAFQTSPTSQHPHPHSPLSAQPHGPPSPPHDSTQPGALGTKTEYHEEHRDNPDEAWRRPMPYAERRRAGKHTKRVVVRT